MLYSVLEVALHEVGLLELCAVSGILSSQADAEPDRLVRLLDRSGQENRAGRSHAYQQGLSGRYQFGQRLLRRPQEIPIIPFASEPLHFGGLPEFCPVQSPCHSRKRGSQIFAMDARVPGHDMRLFSTTRKIL